MWHSLTHHYAHFHNEKRETRIMSKKQFLRRFCSFVSAFFFISLFHLLLLLLLLFHRRVIAQINLRSDFHITPTRWRRSTLAFNYYLLHFLENDFYFFIFFPFHFIHFFVLRLNSATYSKSSNMLKTSAVVLLLVLHLIKRLRMQHIFHVFAHCSTAAVATPTTTTTSAAAAITTTAITTTFGNRFKLTEKKKLVNLPINHAALNK